MELQSKPIVHSAKSPDTLRSCCCTLSAIEISKFWPLIVSSECSGQVHVCVGEDGQFGVSVLKRTSLCKLCSWLSPIGQRLRNLRKSRKEKRKEFKMKTRAPGLETKHWHMREEAPGENQDAKSHLGPRFRKGSTKRWAGGQLYVTGSGRSGQGERS